tara:strand:+ start:283 stop:1422 length:1140 start_codon:yes stop_codon:yes gene_type:complete
MAGLFSDENEFGPFASGKGGSQRDLADAIFSVDAKQTPLMSLIPKSEGVINTTYEYPVDKQLAPKDNATDDSYEAELDGVDKFEKTLDDYSIIQNNVQWFRRAALIGRLAESASNLAGAPDLRATSIRKQLEAIKRDMEVRLCADDVPNDAGGTYYSADSSSGPLKTRALGKFIDSDAPTTSIPSAFRTPAGSIVEASEVEAVGSLTESHVQDVLQSIYEETGVAKELVLLCGVNLKKQFRNFTESTTTDGSNNLAATRIRTLNQDAESRSIISTIDVFEGDFGTLSLVPSLFLAKNDWSSGTTGDKNTDTSSGLVYDADTSRAYGYVLDTSMLELRFHQLPSVRPLPDLGSGDRYEINSVAGLSVLNPLAFGAFKHTS